MMRRALAKLGSTRQPTAPGDELYYRAPPQRLTELTSGGGSSVVPDSGGAATTVGWR